MEIFFVHLSLQFQVLFFSLKIVGDFSFLCLKQSSFLNVELFFSLGRGEKDVGGRKEDVGGRREDVGGRREDIGCEWAHDVNVGCGACVGYALSPIPVPS